MKKILGIIITATFAIGIMSMNTPQSSFIVTVGNEINVFDEKIEYTTFIETQLDFDEPMNFVREQSDTVIEGEYEHIFETMHEYFVSEIKIGSVTYILTQWQRFYTREAYVRDGVVEFEEIDDQYWPDIYVRTYNGTISQRILIEESKGWTVTYTL